jgi:hypothetical protein
MNVLRVVLSQIGSSKERGKALALLLDQTDLPESEWINNGEFAWKNRTSGRSGKSVLHNKKAGGFKAYRSFKLRTSHKGLWVEAMPFASDLDAERAIPLVHQYSKKGRFSGVTITEEKVVADRRIQGVSKTWISEAKTTGKNGTGSAWYIVGSVDQILFIVSCSGVGDDWSWEEVVSIVVLQAEKIRSGLDGRHIFE